MVSKQAIVQALKQVQDPEIGLDIVNLGLLYAMDIDPEPGVVALRMTLTSPGCPVGPAIGNAAATAILALEGVRQVKVQIVWQPAWRQEMMSDEARAQLRW